VATPINTKGKRPGIDDLDIVLPKPNTYLKHVSLITATIFIIWILSYFPSFTGITGYSVVNETGNDTNITFTVNQTTESINITGNLTNITYEPQNITLNITNQTTTNITPETTDALPTTPDAIDEPLVQNVSPPEELVQGEAVVGQPVNWTKRITVSQTGSVSLRTSVPKQAKNIEVYEKEIPSDKEMVMAEPVKRKLDKSKFSIIQPTEQDIEEASTPSPPPITGFVASDIDAGENWLSRLFSWLSHTFGITGAAVLEDVQIQLETPQDNATVGRNLNFLYQTNVDLDLCTLYFDNNLVKRDLLVIAGTNFFDLRGISPGTHTWQVICFAGRQKFESDIWTIVSEELTDEVIEPIEPHPPTPTEESEESIEINITDTIEEGTKVYEITYETPGPIKTEELLSSTKKKIIISSDIHYTDIRTETQLPGEYPEEAIDLYWTTGNKKELVNDIEYIDADSDSLIDAIGWTVPHLSNQTYELEINILNVQSYPTVGGNWTVMFETVGTANLTITPISSTTFAEFLTDNTNTDDDLEFLDLRCGETSLKDQLAVITAEGMKHTYSDLTEANSIAIESLFIEDFTCNDTAHLTDKVLTPGKHSILFQFGEHNATAHNDACVNPSDDLSITTNTTFCSGTFYVNDTAEDGLVKIEPPDVCSGTAAYTTPGDADASSFFAGKPSAPPSNAIDEDTGTRWQSLTTTDEWLQLDMRDVTCMSGIRVYMLGGLTFEDTDLRVSNDTITWTTVDTGWRIAAGAWRSNSFSEIQAQYITLNFTGTIESAYNVAEVDVNSRNTAIEPVYVWSNNTIIIGNNTGFGFYGEGLDNSYLDGIILANYTYGVYIGNSNSDNILYNVTIENCTYCVYINESDNNNITNTTCEDNDYGIYMRASTGNYFWNDTIINNTYGMFFNASDSNTVNNSVFTDNTYGFYSNDSDSNDVTDSTFDDNDYAVYLDQSTSNTIWANDFSTSTYYHAWADKSGNDFDITVGSAEQGNTWDDLPNLDIFDFDGDGYADSGTQYPYNSTNGGNVSVNVTDWGPTTNLTCYDSDGDGSYNTSSYSGCADYFDCDDSNATLIAPYDNLVITNTTMLCNGTYNVADSGADGILQFGARNRTLTCNGTKIIGDNTGYGILLADGNVTLEDCTFSNYSSAGYTMVRQNWSLTWNPTDDDAARAVAVDSNDNIIAVGAFDVGSSDDDWAIAKFSNGGTQAWNQTARWTDGYDRLFGVDTFSNDDIIVVGYRRPSTYYDWAWAKYDREGNQLWNKTNSDSWTDNLYDVITDSQDNFIMCGYDGTGSTRRAYFIGSYNSAGVANWNRTDELSNSYDYCNGVDVDSDDNVTTIATWTNSGQDDWLITKYNSTGSVIWNHTLRWNASGDDWAEDIVVDQEDNIIAVGAWRRNTQFQWGVVKYAPDGTQEWNTSAIWNATASNYAYDVTVDSDNNIFVFGTFYSGQGDWALIKYDSAGNQQWNKTFVWNATHSDSPHSITIDSRDDLIMAGDWDNNGQDAWALAKLHPDNQTVNISGFKLMNNTFTNSTTGLNISDYAHDSIIRNNTFLDNDYGVYVDTDPSGNLFYHNNFTGSVYYHAYSLNSSNQFDLWTSGLGGGIQEGNWWDDILSLDILDSDDDGFGDTGTQHPYNRANGGNVSGNVTDRRPITTKVCYDSDDDGSYNTSSHESCADYWDCDDSDATLLAPRNDLTVKSDTTLCNGTYEINDTAGVGIVKFGAGNITITCNGTQVIGNNSGVGLLNTYGNVSAKDCTFSNYSRAGLAGALWNRTIPLDLSDTDWVYGAESDSEDNYYIVGRWTLGGTDDDWGIIKYNSTGSQVWNLTLDWNTTGSDWADDAVVDSGDDVYFTGWWRNGAANYDWSIARYYSNGTQDWNETLKWNSTSDDVIYGSALDSDDNLIVAGAWENNGDKDWGLAKYDRDGNQLWNRTLVWNSAEDDWGWDAAVDSADSIYIAGYEDNNNQYDWALAKYDSDGNQEWNETLVWNSTGHDTATAVEVDSEDNIYITGGWDNNDQNDIAVAKYNSAGTLLWKKSLTNNTGIFGSVYDIDIDSNDNVIIAGYLPVGGTYNGAVFKLNSSGNQLWNRTLAFNGTGSDLCRDVAIDSADNIVVACWWTNNGQYDWGVAKISGEGDVIVSDSLFINNTFTNSTRGLELANRSERGIFRNNTFPDNDYGIYIGSTPINNVFYYNNFSGSSYYHAYSLNSTNEFNTTSGSDAHGNWWDDASSLDIIDNNNDGFANTGSDYPYNSTNNGNVSVGVTDWGPIVFAQTCYDNDGDGAFNSSSDPTCADYFDCDDNNASLLPPRDELNITTDTWLCSGRYEIGNTVAVLNGVVNFNAGNITLTCLGTIIHGNKTGYGIFSADYTNITIKDCYLSNHSTGIYVDDADNSNITNNTVYNSSGTSTGILVRYTSGIEVSDNTVTDQSWGIYTYGNYNNTFLRNNASYNSYGFYFPATSTGEVNSSVLDNTACDNEYGFYLTKLINGTVRNNTACSNTVSHGIYVGNDFNTLTNNTAYDNSNTGIYVSGNNNTLINNTAYDNSNGFYVYSSGAQYNNFTENRAYSNSNGFLISYGSGNVFYNNTAYSNTAEGFSSSQGAYDNTFEENEVYSNGQSGIRFTGGSHNNTITKNEIYSHTGALDRGILLYDNSDNNTFTNNTLYSNDYNVLIYESRNNTFYYNNFSSATTYHAWSNVTGNHFNTTQQHKQWEGIKQHH
jgi:uncharacterized delta-60 repeat protein